MKRIFNVFRSPASSPQSSQQKLPRVDDSDVEGHRPAGTASALPESRRVGEIKATSKLVQSQGKYQGQPQQAADATSTMVAATPKPQELASDSSRRGSAVSVASTRSRGRQASLDMRIAIPQSQRGSVSSQASTVPDRETFQQTLAKAQVDPQYAFNAARYEMGDVLGVGSFGKVVAARDRAMGGREVAIKKLTRKDAAKDAQKLWNELHILSQLQHPNLAALLDWGISGSKVYMVTEIANGGDLFGVLMDRGLLTENETRLIAKKILDAVAYLHEHGVVHRDLKPENILISDADRRDFHSLVITDFGVSKMVDERNPAKTMTGSAGYIAPEVLSSLNKAAYDGTASDMWSVGVILFILITGSLPYDPSGSASTQLENLVHSPLLLCNDPQTWGRVSEEARQFVLGFLQIKPTRRMSAISALGHAWLADMQSPDGEQNLWSPAHKALYEARTLDESDRDAKSNTAVKNDTSLSATSSRSASPSRSVSPSRGPSILARTPSITASIKQQMQHKFAIADHHTLYDPVEHQPTLYETDEGDGKSEMSGEGK